MLSTQVGTITVLRRMANHDLVAQYEHETPVPCELFSDGQVFNIETWNILPEGFCVWAWADIQPKIELAKKLGTVIACCTDGFMPVVFEIVRTDRN